jgi:hypothetical protein
MANTPSADNLSKELWSIKYKNHSPKRISENALSLLLENVKAPV